MKKFLLSIFFTFIAIFALNLVSCHRVNPFVQEKLVVSEWHNGTPSKINFTADGKFIMTVGAEIKIWDSESGFLLKTIYNHGDNIYKNATDVSPGGKYCLYPQNDGGTPFIEICDILSEKVIFRWQGESTDALFSPDGKYFLISQNGRNGTEIVFYDLKSFKKEFSLQKDGYKAREIVFSEDGVYLSAQFFPIDDLDSKENFNIIWSVDERKIVSEAEFSDLILASGVAISSDNAYIACKCGEKIFVRELASNEILYSFSTDHYYSTGIKFVPETNAILVTGGFGIEIYDFKTGEKLGNHFEDEIVEGLCYSPDKTQQAILCIDKLLILPLGKSEDLKVSPQNAPLSKLTPLPNGFFLARGNGHNFVFDENFSLVEVSKDFSEFPFETYAICDRGIYFVNFKEPKENWNQIWFYDFETGDAKSVLHYDDDGVERITKIAASDDGNILAMADEKGRTFCENVANQESLFWFGNDDAIKNDVREIYVSPLGNTIFIVGGEDTIVLDLTSDNYWGIVGKKVSSFSKKGNYVALSGDDSTFICKICEEGYFKKYDGLFFETAFSPDEKYFARTKLDDENHTIITIEKIQNGEKKEIIPLDSYIKKLFFSDDGTKIITLNGAGIIRCYSATTGKLLTSTICDSDDEWLTYMPNGDFKGSDGGKQKFAKTVSGMEIRD